MAIDVGMPTNQFRDMLVADDTIIGYGLAYELVNNSWQQGLLLAKLDSSGKVWKTKLILDSSGDHLGIDKHWGKIVKTSDGGYAMTAAPFYSNSAVLIKTDSDFEVEFIKEYPDTVNLSNYAYTLIEVSGGYLLYGAIQRPDYYNDGFIRYVDKQGETIWFKYLSYSVYNNSILDIKQVNDSIYVAGIGTGASINPHTGFTSLLYFDLEGNELNYWASDIEPEIGYVRKIIPTNDGGIILFGLHKADFVSGTALFQPTLSKLDSNFQIEWVSHFGPIRSLVSYITLWDFAPTADGHYIGAGETLVKDGDDPTRRVGWLYKFSAGGDSLWERKVNAPFLPLYYTNSGFFGGVGVLSSGSIVAGGTTNEGNTKYCWLVKVTNDGCLDTLWCQTVTLLPPLIDAPIKLSVWPNPATDFIFIDANAPFEGEFILYDLESKIIHRQSFVNQLSVSVFNIPSGIYYGIIQNSAGYFERKKIVVLH
ncbi:MAG: T9SS type A sorting domain-containing protein [Saprospiraceae bacterium]|nr:T9SS type A sorting domain-containing protein [Saprospiraceae bacterium]